MSFAGMEYRLMGKVMIVIDLTYVQLLCYKGCMECY
jgi:hypothetical protein